MQRFCTYPLFDPLGVLKVSKKFGEWGESGEEGEYVVWNASQLLEIFTALQLLLLESHLAAGSQWWAYSLVLHLCLLLQGGYSFTAAARESHLAAGSQWWAYSIILYLCLLLQGGYSFVLECQNLMLQSL